MELIGEVAINAPREQVWRALNDAEVLQSCIPGCEQVTDVSPTERQVRVMVKMGPVRARFNGKVSLSDVQAPERCLMKFEGSGGAAGMASGQSQVELLVNGDGTRLTYTVKASVGGKLGQIGGRMMDASAKQLADQFFVALRQKLEPQSALVTVDGDQVLAANTPGLGHEAPPHLTALPGAPETPLLTHRNTTPTTAAQPQAHSPNPEVQRVLWFLLGVASTGFGVWLGARLF